jgi:hypothetical protein
MTKKKERIATISGRVMSLEETEREKQRGTPLGESLRKADMEYEKRRRKE